MRWNRYFSSVLLLMLCTKVMAGDMQSDSINVFATGLSQYEKNVIRYQKHWASLIPSQFVIQNAGNMGVVSLGCGWDYGKHNQWETHVLLGYIPKHQSNRGKLMMTVKENFLPWDIDLKHGWSLQPLQASIYLNTVYGHEFWKTQPGRYPDSYYDFMSTKFRLNAAIGQRITWQIPAKSRKLNKSVSFFYEISSCDLYIRSKFMDSSVSLSDILGLSIGVKFQTF